MYIYMGNTILSVRYWYSVCNELNFEQNNELRSIVSFMIVFVFYCISMSEI